MDKYEKIEDVYSKSAINNRAIEALYAILNNKLVPTKSDLAFTLGSKPAKFSEILNGRMKMGVDMIAVICDHFDVDPNWLLMGRGNKIFKIRKNLEPFFEGDLRSEDLDRLYPHASEEEIEAEVEAMTTVLDSGNNTDQTKYDSMAEIFYKKTLEQAEEIGKLKARIKDLEQRLGKTVGDVNIGGTANAG